MTNTAAPTPPAGTPRQPWVMVVVAVAVLVALALVVAAVLARRDTTTTTTGTTTPGASSTSASTVATTSTTTTSTSRSSSTSTSAKAATTTTAGGASSTTAPATKDQTCESARAGLRLTYPAGWHTATNPEWACLLFDPDPIDVPVQSELPFVAVAVVPEDVDFAAATARALGTSTATIEAQDGTSLGGRPTLCIVAISNGEGLLEAGTRTYTCYVDFGTKAISFGNNRVPGGADRGFDEAVRAVAASAATIS